MPSNYSRTSKEPFHNSVAWLQPIYEFIFDVTWFECAPKKMEEAVKETIKG